MNKRGWYVLVSIASDDGDYCVDIFERAEGDFGFQHFRSDPEDGGAWTPIGGGASDHFESPIEAAAAALAAVQWLTTHTQAARALSEWKSTGPFSARH